MTGETRYRAMTTGLVLMLGVSLLAFQAHAQESKAGDSSDDTKALKQRFKERFPTLLALENAGKIGETYKGYIDVVDPGYRGQKVDPSEPESATIADLVAAENDDREALYDLLAAQLKVTRAQVAARNARRNFAKARPEHYLQLDSGAWVQKKKIAAKKRPK